MGKQSVRTLVLLVELLAFVLAWQFLNAGSVKADALWVAGAGASHSLSAMPQAQQVADDPNDPPEMSWTTPAIGRQDDDPNDPPERA